MDEGEPVPKNDESDFLDEIIEERSRTNPAFLAAVDEAYERRVLLRKIADARKAANLTRTMVAARMGTSEAAVARLEAATGDPKASTIERFAAAVGKRIRWELVDTNR
jgi:ribosome-binding protein aMBF1 (putative translation factor)